MTDNTKINETHIEDLITDVVHRTLQSIQQKFNYSEWMSLKEAAQYANVSYNTLMKFRVMGLKISEIEGVKRVSKKEIDRFLEQHSF